MATTRLLSAMVATWNNVATTFTGLKLNVTDTASASGSLLMDLQVDGVSQLMANKSGVVIAVSRFVAPFYYVNNDTGAIFFGASLDTVIQRDGAANTLALRNGTAAQSLNIYNTYTDASNYERGVFDWAGTANTLRIGTEAAGTGTVRNIQLVAGSNSVTMTPGAANLLTLNGPIAVPNAGWVGTVSRGGIVFPDDGVLRLTNNAGTDFTRLILGTNDTSGVAIKKNGTQVDIRLGDDSAYANLTAAALTGLAKISVTGTTVTASAPVLDLAQTWNNGAVAFTGAKFNVTDTASAAGSLLMDLQKDGVTYFSVGRNNQVYGSTLRAAADGLLAFTGRSQWSSPADGTMRLANTGNTQSVDFTVGASNLLTLNGGLKTTGATFALQTATTLTDNAAAQVATMTNGPTAGNPTKWIAINDNGTTRYIPAW